VSLPSEFSGISNRSSQLFCADTKREATRSPSARVQMGADQLGSPHRAASLAYCQQPLLRRRLARRRNTGACVRHRGPAVARYAESLDEPDSVLAMIDDAVICAGHDLYRYAQFPIAVLHRGHCRNHSGGILSLSAESALVEAPVPKGSRWQSFRAREVARTWP
jgi:hypothetical protein